MRHTKQALTFLLETREIGVLFAAIALSLFFFAGNKIFLSPESILITLRMASELGIVACGVTLLMICGEFDLSIGSVSALCAITGALLSKAGVNLWLAFSIGLILGISIGFMNGIITTKLHVPSFITTLGVMLLCRGLALTISEGMPLRISTSSPLLITIIGSGELFGIPVAIAWFIFFLLLSKWLLDHTSFGNRTYSTGGNEQAAFSSGVDITKVKIINFMLVGFLASFVGFVSAFRLGSISPIAGRGLELQAIAATVIGGTALSGGVGTTLGTALGAIITGQIQNGLILLGATAYLHETFLGIIIIIAVTMNRLITRK